MTENKHDDARGASTSDAGLGAERYAVMVGVKCYGSYSDQDKAIDRAKFWGDKYPDAHVYVERRATVWDDGKTWELTRILRDGLVPNAIELSRATLAQDKTDAA